MRSVNKALLKGSACLPLIVLALSGCATVEPAQPIKAGDAVGVHFTCRQSDGKIAISTYKEINESALPKSPLFIKRDRGDAVVLTAGNAQPVANPLKMKAFEVEIKDRLGSQLVGLKQGESASIRLGAERFAGLPESEQYLKLARVRYHPKEVKLKPSQYKEMTKKDAAVGQSIAIEPAVPGKVVSVSDKEVVIHFSARDGEEIDLPYGRATIRDKGNHYEIDIHAVKGTLVRSADMAARIVDVDENMMKLDFGHPFAGEVLNCDVKVDSVQPGQAATAAGDAAGMKAGQAGEVQSGDLVTINYTATLEDGSIFDTTIESVAKDPARKKVTWFTEKTNYAAAEFVAGKQELIPGLGEALPGMAIGDKKQLKLTPDKAFGPFDPNKKTEFPCVRTIPRVIHMPAEEYVKLFSSFPVLKKEVDLVPFFKSRIIEVTERDVAMENLAKNGVTAKESYGTVLITVDKDQITTTLKPIIGATFPLKEGTGIIASTDGKTFTVDNNNPLAGKNIVIDLEVVSLTKAAVKPIDWIENQEKGLAKAKQEGKPVFLILYADWCGWCKKTFTETLPDPRIGKLMDKFVWMKLNSDKEKKYKEQYGQNGFPMMVILKPDGTVLKKIDGYRDARGLKTELEAVKL
jgi:FKBP-type peptidyl-prolyl cis-trans isomerase 2